MKQSLLTLSLLSLSTFGISQTYDCSNLPQWQSSTAYGSSSQVQYQNHAYRAAWWTQGSDPLTHSGPWQEWIPLGDCGTLENQLPSVSLTTNSPSSLLVGQSFTVTANASDSDGVVTQVDFFENQVLVLSDTTSPFEYSATPSHAGTYQIHSIAMDDNQESSQISNSISFEMTEANNLTPTATLTNLGNSELIEGEFVNLMANASDIDGTVSSVSFYQNGEFVLQDNSAPYELALAPLAGQHQFTVTATDNNRAVSAFSNNISVNVEADSATLITTINLVSPNATSVNLGNEIIFQVDAFTNDVNQLLESVELYANNQLLNSKTSAPFNAAYLADQVGNLELKAIATDVNGLQTIKLFSIQVIEVSNSDYLFENNFEQHSIGAYSAEQFESDWGFYPNTSAGVADNRLNIVNDPSGVSNKVLRVTYSANGTGGSSASVFKYTIPGENHNQMWLQYKVMFDENYTFVKGGKLPGLSGYTGTKPTGCLSNSSINGFSSRFMWREKGQILQYMYNPTKSEYCGDYTSSYNFFEKNVWYTLTSHVTLNDVGQANGNVESFIDGQSVINIENIMLRNDSAVSIDKLLFETFFGGSSSSWAPSTQQFSYFDNIVIDTTSPLNLVDTVKQPASLNHPVAGYELWSTNTGYDENSQVHVIDESGAYHYYKARYGIAANKNPLDYSLPENYVDVHNPVKLDYAQPWVEITNP